MISIHTALAGCDTIRTIYMLGVKQFQSTQPSQAVTLVQSSWTYSHLISIHTALAGCDNLTGSVPADDMAFQSTQPSQAVTPLLT